MQIVKFTTKFDDLYAKLTELSNAAGDTKGCDRIHRQKKAGKQASKPLGGKSPQLCVNGAHHEVETTSVYSLNIPKGTCRLDTQNCVAWASSGKVQFSGH